MTATADKELPPRAPPDASFLRTASYEYTVQDGPGIQQFRIFYDIYRSHIGKVMVGYEISFKRLDPPALVKEVEQAPVFWPQPEYAPAEA